MKKIILFLSITLFVLPVQVKANEGMWFLMFLERLNQRDMQKMGLQLTAEEIYSINNHSLKDAIVQFNGGCTAEMVSKNGLVLTNHHCGYDVIAELSSEKNNYLKNGFWAKDLKEEMKPKSLYVRFFVRMDDVTKRILSLVNDKMDEKEREAVINQEIQKIQEENNEGGKYTVSVRPFFQGNEYYYFVYQDYTDVRLVGTPPESIGKFGGDTDNWEWPRHTGDFSMFRVYGDKDGNPAEYSPDNVPLQPKHHLPISIKGYDENDFAMILGYPGRTNRWMPSGGIEQNVKYAYPAWVEGAKNGMDVMKKHMDANETINLKYASKYARTSNYWKNRQGMIDALTKFNTAAKKADEEKKFDVWAKKAANKAKYGNVVSSINKYYQATDKKASHDSYLMQLIRTSTYAAMPANFGNRLLKYYNEPNNRTALKPQLLEMADNYYDEFYLPLEEEIFAAQLNLYTSKAKENGVSPMLAEIKDRNNIFEKVVYEASSKSIFSSKERVLDFINNPASDVISNDMLYILSSDIMNKYREKSPDLEVLENDFLSSYRLLVEGLRESGLNKIKYPDANSTLRLTYGKVRSLPKDSRNDARINNFTTMDGLVKKYKQNDPEFDMPVEILELNASRKYGQYADKEGVMPINFLTDNDITGGNSGSPVLNGKGELIGLAFDGNIEAMAGDVIFDDNLQRTINVDIRYVLWIIDVYSGAQNIIDELTIIKN